jgi:hypothetical protein
LAAALVNALVDTFSSPCILEYPQNPFTRNFFGGYIQRAAAGFARRRLIANFSG